MAGDPKRVQEIFLAAVERPAAERPAYLDRECGGDAELRRRVEELLQAHAASGSFLDRPAAPASATGEYTPQPEAAPSPSTTPALPGAAADVVIAGRYTLVEKIGEGGMGEVWVAKQTQPVRRAVAVKLIKAGMDTAQVLARFEAERQALALMDHPNIAKVLDAGAAPDGRPFFVMELVKGVPITQFCDQRRLTPRQRLELFVPVCQAIQHAHQKGVIHRDIKPSNVLVALYDDKPVPKVIDFGVAKAAGQALTEETIMTAFGAVVGTPEYMSPEQASFNQLDVDTRSDVYALGVLLYELLTGSPPFPKKELEKAGMLEVLRLIREQDPPRPSTRLSSPGTPPEVAAARGTEPGRLAGLVRGELDWIVMRALEKDRGRRYETANGLAADVQRYLAGEPVQAAPPSATYRLRKFARRHRGPVAAGLTITALLVAGVIVSGWLAVWATRAERDAVEQRDQATTKRQEAETAREDLRRLLYAAHLNLAQAAWEGERLDRTLALLRGEKEASPDLCGFEWRYWMRQCHGDLRTLELPGLSEWTAFSADATRVAALDLRSADGAKWAFKVWDTTSGREVASVPLTAPGSSGPALSPDGSRLAFGLESMGKEPVQELVVVDLATGRRTTTVKLDTVGLPLSLTFSPDGKRLAAVVRPPGSKIDPGATRGELRLWDAATGRQLHAFPEVLGDAPRPAFSADGARVAVVSAKTGKPHESELKVWEVSDGRPVLTLLAALGGVGSAVAFSPDGKSVAAVGMGSPAAGALQVWDLPSGRPRFTASGPFRLQFVQVALSPDGGRIAWAGGSSQVGLWDAHGGRQLAMFRGHRGEVDALAFSPDGRHLLSADAVGGLKVWDARPPGDTLVLDPGYLMMQSGAVSPDGGRVASVGTGKDAIGLVKVWDRTGRELLGLKLPDNRPGELGLSAKLAFSSGDGRLALARAWFGDGKLRSELTVWDAAGGELLHRADEGVGLQAVALSPDGKRVAASTFFREPGGGPQPWTVRVWEVADGKQTLEVTPFSTLFVGAVAFSPDGTRLAAVAGSRGQTSQVLAWDARSGEEVGRWTGPEGMGTGVAFSPDGRRLAAVVSEMTRPGELLLCDLASGESRSLGNGAGGVTFSPDGTRLAAYVGALSRPAEVGLWDVATGRELLVLKGHAGMAWDDGLAFTPDGHQLISTAHLAPGEKVEVKLWDARPLPAVR
jgi:WD40 repeat protein